MPDRDPGGPNIGLIGSLATYGKINKHGFIETPYRRSDGWSRTRTRPRCRRQTLSEDLTDGRKVLAKAGTVITEKVWATIKDQKLASIRIRPVVTDQIDYLAADEEEKFYIAQANAPLDDGQHFVEERVMVRYRDKFLIEPADDVDYMDVSPKQIVSVATALIPFLEHETRTGP